jgi:hypothetical protein
MLRVNCINWILLSVHHSEINLLLDFVFWWAWWKSFICKFSACKFVSSTGSLALWGLSVMGQVSNSCNGEVQPTPMVLARKSFNVYIDRICWFLDILSVCSFCFKCWLLTSLNRPKYQVTINCCVWI